MYLYTGGGCEASEESLVAQSLNHNHGGEANHGTAAVDELSIRGEEAKALSVPAVGSA